MFKLHRRVEIVSSAYVQTKIGIAINYDDLKEGKGRKEGGIRGWEEA